MITAVHRSPNKLWRSNSIFNPTAIGITKMFSIHLGGFTLIYEEKKVHKEIVAKIVNFKKVSTLF